MNSEHIYSSSSFVTLGQYRWLSHVFLITGIELEHSDHMIIESTIQMIYLFYLCYGKSLQISHQLSHSPV